MSHSHGIKISGSQQTMVLEIWQKKMKKIDFCWSSEQGMSEIFLECYCGARCSFMIIFQ